MMNIIAICLISLVLSSCTAVTVLGYVSSAYNTGKLVKDFSEENYDFQSTDNVSAVWNGESTLHNPNRDIHAQHESVPEVQQQVRSK